jgi:hypothetical protein
MAGRAGFIPAMTVAGVQPKADPPQAEKPALSGVATNN